MKLATAFWRGVSFHNRNSFQGAINLTSVYDINVTISPQADRVFYCHDLVHVIPVALG